MTSKWDERFLRLAEEVSTWSKDPSTKVGAVVTRPDNTIASVGFNGFPKGCNDSAGKLNDRDTKIARTVHAELNAVLNAHERLDGYTIYTTHPPCAQCSAVIVQSGIKEVVCLKPSEELLSRWGESLQYGIEMLHEAGVFYVEQDPEESSCQGTPDTKVQAKGS